MIIREGNKQFLIKADGSKHEIVSILGSNTNGVGLPTLPPKNQRDNPLGDVWAPGFNAPKIDQNLSIRNIFLQGASIAWSCVVPPSISGKEIKWEYVYLSDNPDEKLKEDWVNFPMFQGQQHFWGLIGKNNLRENIVGIANRKGENGRLVVPISWTYLVFVRINIAFNHPPHDTSKAEKVWYVVSLHSKNIKEGMWHITKEAKRACINPEAISFSFAYDFNARDEIGLWLYHTFSGEEWLAFAQFQLIKLS